MKCADDPGNWCNNNFRTFDKTRKMIVKSELKEMLDRLRKKSDVAPSLEEITKEIEAVRKSRNDNRQKNKI